MESAPKTTWAAGSDGRADVGGKCSSGAGRARDRDRFAPWWRCINLGRKNGSFLRTKL